MEDDNKKELIRFQITGLPTKQWDRLQGQIFDIIEDIASKVSLGSGTGEDIAKDISEIALNWIKAKVEKPSLENEKLKSEIALNFANYKKTISESQKTNEERIGVQIDNLTKLVNALAILKGASISFSQVGQEGHLIIGPTPKDLSIENNEVGKEGK